MVNNKKIIAGLAAFATLMCEFTFYPCFLWLIEQPKIPGSWLKKDLKPHI